MVDKVLLYELCELAAKGGNSVVFLTTHGQSKQEMRGSFPMELYMRKTFPAACAQATLK